MGRGLVVEWWNGGMVVEIAKWIAQGVGNDADFEIGGNEQEKNRGRGWRAQER